ncbi:hypothetical protein PHLCEN_2v13384 [Hermanssonia centrifuga]|uniref:Branched-chain alpha-ketoacid dehydrogenase kinase/Pyruvate dehydrogenase kinase N-terminal domain-containing protein n=1 Tax=Hermanssonia centrifuga TaxID=98765 RepID=A0A2R6NEG0_9APHY|nr:hypothetical protein PHLCEN_2v13384 [Hermanssonia centrifuga]
MTHAISLSVAAANGSIWPESKSGYPPERQSISPRVKELDELPHNLSLMPSIKKVKDWYAQSFEELVNFPAISLPPHIREALLAPPPNQPLLPESTPNPSLTYFSEDYSTPSAVSAYNGNGKGNGNGNGKGTHHQKMRIPMERR